jgi:acetyl-CoA carboxylase alpha subunit
MLENAVYSVITPEGFASIIFKDESRAEEAANLMKMSAQDLLENEIIDGILPEYGGATQEHLDDIVKDMSIVIDNFIRSNYTSSGESIINQKLQKFNKLY